MSKRNSIAKMHDEMTEWRRELHEHPATAFEETFASEFIANKLKEWGIEHKTGYGKTGIAGVIEGRENSSGKAIALRADMDALDIFEESGQPWSSRIEGKMHGCGHDGHMTMLLGALKYLKDNPNFNGKVHFIFQPAEEPLQGAQAMMRDGLFDDFPSEMVFGMHNWPSLPKGSFGTRPGAFMGGTSHFEVILTGRGGHGANPHETIDPVLIGCEIIMALQTLVSRNTDPTEPAVVHFPVFQTGIADDIVPERAYIAGAIRAFNSALIKRLENRVNEVCSHIAAAHGGTAEVRHLYESDVLQNDDDATKIAVKAAEKVAGRHNVITNQPQFLAGEDFGAFSQKIPGNFIFIGQGETRDSDSPHNQGLHSPLYDFNDDILPIGADYWVELVETTLPLNK